MADFTTGGDHGAQEMAVVGDGAEEVGAEQTVDILIQREEAAVDHRVDPVEMAAEARPAEPAAIQRDPVIEKDETPEKERAPEKERTASNPDADELFRKTPEQNELRLASDSPELLPELSRLAASRIRQGTPADAEPLIRRILAITESQSEGNDPDVVILVNDLARLCLGESAYEFAEPLLLRLLEWKQSKGEHHPEVATVIASLAHVREVLGDHASSEELWRRVLEIRELKLAPNHFAIATALEHLAEACAARGKVGEAVQLFQRARTIRQLTLGSQHPSVRAALERIADLQLQAQEFVEPESVGSPVSAHEKPTELFADLQGIAAISASGRPSTTAANQRKTHFERDVSSRPTKDGYLGTSPPASPMGGGELMPKGLVPYKDVILSIKQELDNPQNGETFGTRATAVLAQLTALVRKRYSALLVALGVTTLLLVAQAGARTQTEKDASKSDELPRRESSVLKTARGTQPSMLATVPMSESQRVAPLARIESPRTAEASTTGTSDKTEVEAASPRAVHEDKEEGSARKGKKNRAERERVSIPNPCRSRRANGCVPTKAIMHLDSIAGAISAGAQRLPVIEPVFNSAKPPRVGSDNLGSYATPLPPQLIGAVPTPTYPPDLTDRNGDVRVRFNVDVNGRPMLSTLKVLSSSDPLFTAAVRKILPEMRFDPARTGGVDPHPTVDAVEIPFRFVRPKK
jgi:tetratricopeptide (TPR) repeat protein